LEVEVNQEEDETAITFKISFKLVFILYSVRSLEVIFNSTAAAEWSLDYEVILRSRLKIPRGSFKE
jgi:hypothetical protein